MGTRITKSCKRGADLQKLSDQQRMFVLELLASNIFSPTEAARKVGYKYPQQQAYRLLKNPKIAAALGKAQREREERCEIKGDDVIAYLGNALYINPMKYFRPSKDGWLVDDPETLPDEVGQLIESMDMIVQQFEDGSQTIAYRVRLLSKAVALGLMMRHKGQLAPEQLNVKQSLVLDWDQLRERSDNGESDPFRKQIEGA